MLSVGVLSYALADAFGGWCSLIRAGCAFGWNLISFDDLQIVWPPSSSPTGELPVVPDWPVYYGSATLISGI